jgi:hypothetical protein
MARKKPEVTAPNSKQLEIRYVPLSAARRWERNPKLHNLDEIIAAIQKYGFQDPPAWDGTLNNGEGGLKHGNGRTEALEVMFNRQMPVPDGIIEQDGEWHLPIVFGNDLPNENVAMAYALDHNNLTLLGGSLSPMQASKMYDQRDYAALSAELIRVKAEPVTVSPEDAKALARGILGREVTGAPAYEETDPEEDVHEKLEKINTVRLTIGSIQWDVGVERFKSWNAELAETHDYDQLAIIKDLQSRLGLPANELASNEMEDDFDDF